MSSVSDKWFPMIVKKTGVGTKYGIESPIAYNMSILKGEIDF